jgi:hypothetical protein
MHIGRLSIRLWMGQFILEDIVIDGLTPESRPFLTARRLAVSMPWSTLVNRRIVFDSIEMTDWRMFVETYPDGRENLPKFTPKNPRGPSSWTTTLAYVHAYRGEFTYQDHGTPWGVVTRNLDVTVGRPTDEYRGHARFSNGTVTIQNYVPMRADMSTDFHIDGGKVILDRIDLLTDGARSEVTGEVDFTRWPEQTYRVNSRVNFPRMREIFWANDDFTLSGDGNFNGVFHLFKGGRELKGTFSSPEAGVNDYRFGDLRGSLIWVPDRFEVTDATATLFGGNASFGYRMAPLGRRDVRATATFDASYEDVDMLAYTSFLELQGLRLAGRATGRNVMEWPLGRFANARGNGEIHVEPPAGVETMTRQLPVVSLERELRAADGAPFSNHTPREPVPIRADVTYTFDQEWVEFGRSRIATPSNVP